MFSTDDVSLPRDWQMVLIRDVTLRTSQRDPRKQPDRTFRYVDVSSVDNSLFKIRSATEIKGAQAPSRARKDIRGSDVLFATVRPTLKRVALVPPELDGEIASTGYCVLRSNGEKVVPSYLYGCLLTDWFIDAMSKLERGANYPAVRDSDVFNTQIPLPPLPEQRKIAGVLGVVQRAIEQQEQLLQLTAELKKTLLHQLFTHGLRGEPHKQTEIGPVPEGWEVVPLKSLLSEPLRNGHSAKATNTAEGIRTLTLTAVTKRDFSIENTKLTVAAPVRVRDLWVQTGDILIERANTFEYVGLAALYEGPGDFAIFPDLMIRVRVDSARIIPKFLSDFLITMPCRTFFQKQARSTAGNFPKIDQTTIEQTLVPLPPMKEQEKIVAALSMLDRKEQAHQGKHAALTDLFRTLLHQLMTAQLRVNDLDLPAPG